MATITVPSGIMDATIRAAKVEGGGTEEDALKQLLLESRGTVLEGGVEKPFFRYAYVAADYVFSDPSRVKEADGIKFEGSLDGVIALLRRQVRLDKGAGVTVPPEWSAETLLQEVLEASGRTPALRTADLESI